MSYVHCMKTAIGRSFTCSRLVSLFLRIVQVTQILI